MPARGNEALAATGRLVRVALRRDRVRIAVWALSVGGLIAYYVAVIPVVYPDQAARQARAALMSDPSGAMLSGPGYGLDHYTLGAMVANEMVGMIATAVALMSAFLVVRNTRTEEETGRTELVRAAVVGRYAPLTAALVDMLVATAVVSVVLLAALVGNGLDLASSLAVSVGVGVAGLVFGAVAAVTSQLSEHARTASGMAGAVVGLAYALRGIGDAQQVGGGALSWLSPIGWVQQTRAFVDLRWWPLLPGVALAAVLVVVAYLLAARRDLGAGLVRSRSGRADARASLLRPVGLVLRLERGSLVGWAVGLGAFGALTGSMGKAVVNAFRERPDLAVMIGGLDSADVLRTALSVFLRTYAMTVAVYAVIVINRMRGEEADGRTGVLLATAVSRRRLVGSTLAVVTAGSAALLVVIGLTLGLGAGASIGDLGLVGEFGVAGLAYLPVVMCFAGLATLAFGAIRTGTWWVWTVVVATLVVGMYGPVLNLPDAVLSLEPFGQVPAVPSVPLDVAPLAWMTAVAVALIAAGLVLFRRRDLREG